MEKAEVILIPSTEFLAHLRECPDLSLRILASLSGHLHELVTTIENYRQKISGPLLGRILTRSPHFHRMKCGAPKIETGSGSKFTLKQSGRPLVFDYFGKFVETQEAETIYYMRTILQSLLFIAITFVYVPGAYATVEMEHSHEVSHGHGHQHTGHGHSHDHEPVHSHEAPDSDEPAGDSHSHTHHVSLGSDIPFTPASHGIFMISHNGTSQAPAISALIPDGPCFSLIKPPQLG